MILKRFVKGITQEAIFQKRAPEKRPDWIDVAELKYASGTSAKEAVIHDAAGLVWAVNLGCIDLNPHPVQADDLDHPDELRVDLDPMPGVEWPQIVDVALVAREVLEDHGLTAWPKTSGSRGFHIYARIAAALAVQVGPAGRRDGRARGRAPGARAGDQPVVEGGAPGRVRRLQPERQGPHRRVGVFGAGDARRAGVHAAALGRGRPTAARRRSRSPPCPTRFAEIGDPWEGMDSHRARSTRCWTWPTGSARRRRRPGCRRSGDRQAAIEMPLIEIARTKTKDEAMAALDVWRGRYPAAAEKLEPADILVDGMRGPEFHLVPHPDQSAACARRAAARRRSR